MKCKRFFTIGLSFLIIFSFCAVTQAYLRRIHVNVWTTNYTDDQQLNIWLEVWDTENKNPPEIITSIEVTAPDGTIFNMTDDAWLPYDRGYWMAARAGDFDSTEIPSGVYKVKVVPNSGWTIEQGDWIDATFLDPPVITYPTEGSTVVQPLTIRWNPVVGAKYYRVLLWNECWNEPVYWFWWNDSRKFYTNLPGAKIPLGQLKPNCSYRLRVEARSGSQDLDKRSRSVWVNFFTGSW